MIISHSVEFVDRSRVNEPLTRVFHTLSLGDAAVAGFFLLSGYLITQSYLSASSPSDYLVRRVLRICPAFIVAYLVSVFVVGPLIGCAPPTDISNVLFSAIALREPVVDGTHLNMPAWTIAYEFRCYLLTLALGTLGLLRRPSWMLLLTGGALLAAFIGEQDFIRWRFQALEHLPGWEETFGTVYILLRLAAPYLVGACIYLFWPRIKPHLTPATAFVGLLGCIALLGVSTPVACAALSTFGAAMLFWLAFGAQLGPLQRINCRWDVSYGVYLYGWGVESVIFAYYPGLSAIELSLAALAAALACGAASWWGVEKSAKDLLRRGRLAGAEGRSPMPAMR